MEGVINTYLFKQGDVIKTKVETRVGISNYIRQLPQSPKGMLFGTESGNGCVILTGVDFFLYTQVYIIYYICSIFGNVKDSTAPLVTITSDNDKDYTVGSIEREQSYH